MLAKNSPEYLFLDQTRFSKDELTREKLSINDLLVLFRRERIVRML